MNNYRRFPVRVCGLFLMVSVFCVLPLARAQFVSLTTEAPVTIMLSTSTISEKTKSVTVKIDKVSTAATQRDSKTVVTRSTQVQLLSMLLAKGIIPDGTVTGWSFVAQRDLVSRLRDLDGEFDLYLAKGLTRVLVPRDEFLDLFTPTRTLKMVEKHIGTYVISSAGTMNNHIYCELNTDFQVGSDTFNVTDSLLDGLAKSTYATKTIANGYNVFFYAISKSSVAAVGGFKGRRQPGNVPTTGTLNLTITIGPAKLVPSSLYIP